MFNFKWCNFEFSQVSNFYPQIKVKSTVKNKVEQLVLIPYLKLPVLMVQFISTAINAFK